MMKSSLKIPPHLKRVTTLPCEMSSTGTRQYSMSRLFVLPYTLLLKKFVKVYTRSCAVKMT